MAFAQPVPIRRLFRAAVCHACLASECRAVSTTAICEHRNVINSIPGLASVIIGWRLGFSRSTISHNATRMQEGLTPSVWRSTAPTGYLTAGVRRLTRAVGLPSGGESIEAGHPFARIQGRRRIPDPGLPVPQTPISSFLSSSLDVHCCMLLPDRQCAQSAVARWSPMFCRSVYYQRGPHVSAIILPRRPSFKK